MSPVTRRRSFIHEIVSSSAVRRRSISAALAVAFAATAAAQTTGPLLLRQPSLSAADICFGYAGDIWLVPRGGGTARRLTATGTASGCSFSPDGRWVAYTGNRAGNNDVYVVATDGGAPRRLTWHPGNDIVRGWTPDGKVMFASDRFAVALSSWNGAPRLFVQGLDAVSAVPLDLPSAWDGSLSPDGQRLAYLPHPAANDIWKHYRGGETTPIWITTLSNAAIEKIPRENSNDRSPMWVGDTVFFISDRDGRASLYSYNTRTKSVARRIDNHGLDIKSASAGPGAIVFEQFGSIHSYDLANGRESVVPIRIAGEIASSLPHWVNVSSRLSHAALSPTGIRAAFDARGEIITVPAKKGDARDITKTVAASEHFPAWSPDGQTLAYFSNAGGAYHLELRGQAGMGEPRAITLGDDDTYYNSPVWSPDGKRIAFANSRAELWYADVASGKLIKVDADKMGNGFGGGIAAGSWSPDSRWLGYSRSIGNRLGAVFVYDVQSARFTQVTDGMSDARSPAFDASGKYLYFVASTDAGPATDFSMTTFDHPITRTLYAIVLRSDLPSPLAPESDEEKAKGDSAAKSNAKAAQGDAAGAKAMMPHKPDSAAAAAPPEPVRVDFEGIDQRTIALPVPPRNYTDVVAGKPGVLVLAEYPLTPVDVQDGGTQILHKFDLAERKIDKLIDAADDYSVSRDGEKLLYGQKGKWTIIPLTQPAKPGEGVLNTADIQVETDPRAEWNEMYHDAFRLQRAFFYDPNYHGLDLAATEKYYAQFLPGLGNRADLDYLFGEIFGNLTVGHLFVSPPPPEGGASAPPRNGLLGADYAAEAGRWRFARVYAGESWNPQTRAPLTQPGVNVRAGEYLLAVDGRAITSNDNVDQALEGTAGKSVVLRVGPNASGAGARDVTVTPLANDAYLRHLAWIDNNRRTVDKLSGGKLAYIYVPNTSNAGYTRFNRDFFAQQDKLGAVVDERFNGGGNIADYIINYLRRDAPFNFVTSRYGADTPIPAGAIYGPKAMLINEYAGSGGDELPWLFRYFKVGTLVGTRTWGGLVGIGGYPTLMDGGSVTAPRGAIWTPERDYAVENHGVAPDVDVDLDPAAWRAGHDTQLEKAVSILMGELATKKYAQPARPVFPVWAKDNRPPQ